jgi:hypothetical protein
MMNLYLIKRLHCPVGQISTILVRNTSADGARYMAADKATGAGGRDAWLHLDRSVCMQIGTTDENAPGVVMVARHVDGEPT